jgi:hypothetical protein
MSFERSLVWVGIFICNVVQRVWIVAGCEAHQCPLSIDVLNDYPGPKTVPFLKASIVSVIPESKREATRYTEKTATYFTGEYTPKNTV